MIVSGVKWVLCFLAWSGAVSVAALDTNYDSVPNVSDTLRLDAAQARLALSVRPDHSLLSICGLQKGQRYSFILVTASPHTKGKVQWRLPGVSNTRPKTDQWETFIAEEDCATIELFNTMGTSVASTLSLGCLSCPPPPRKAVFDPALTSLQTDPNYSANTLVEDIFVSGNCFSVDPGSINFDGYARGLGYFSSGSSSINIEEGIILSTGRTTSAEGRNAVNSATTELKPINASDFDPDLSQLINYTQPLTDLQILEFEFVPTSAEVSFDYVFASEEYCEYVNSNFNDVFGFFISGPGINGPFSNQAENIALIPGSSDYISINSVNHLSNSNYYVNNIPANHFTLFPFVALECNNHPIENGPANDFIEFDGFTTVLTARADVIPCETYRIKLAIADVADRRFDSAVFLRANSFNAGGAADATTDFPTAFGGRAYEGCTGSQFVFQRQDGDLSTDLTVRYTISNSSTATPGSDYEALPDSIVIPAGEEFFYLPVNVYDDPLFEADETIILDLEAPCSCATPFVEMTITDPVPLALELFPQSLCAPATIDLNVSLSGGLPDFQYQWSSGDTDPQASVFVDRDTTFYLTVTDYCGRSIRDSVDITFIQTPEAIISGDYEICPEGDPAILTITFSQAGTHRITYSIDGVPQAPIDNITVNPYTLEATVTGDYELLAVNNESCAGSTFGLASVRPLVFDLQASVDSLSCTERNDGAIEVHLDGGQAPYTYQWQPGGGNVPRLENLAAGLYALTITDANACTISDSFRIDLSTTIPFAIANDPEVLTCSKTEITIIGDGSTGGAYAYQWSTPDGQIVSGATTLRPLVTAGGTYRLVVTHLPTACAATTTALVLVDTLAPQAEIIPLGPLPLSCTTTSTILDGSASQPLGSLLYRWSSPDVSIPGPTDQAVLSLDRPGTYELQVTNITNGCTATEILQIVADTTRPALSIAPPDEINCRDSLVRLDARASVTGPEFSYRWTASNGGQILSGATSLEPLVDRSGDYRLEIEDLDNGCRNTGQTVVVENKVAPLARATAPERLDCNTSSVYVDGSGSSEGVDLTYRWASATGVFRDDSLTLRVEVEEAGLYYLYVTDQANGCVAVAEVWVEEEDNRPEAIDLLPQAPPCYGDPGALVVRDIVGGFPPYLYSYDGGATFGSDSLRTGLASGDYELVVQDLNGCELRQPFRIPFLTERFVLLDPIIEVELGESAELEVLTNLPSALIDSVRWWPAEGLDCADCLEPTALVYDWTDYSLTVIDTNGCVLGDATQLRVRKERRVYIPNVFSPNGDGVNDWFFIHSDPSSVRQIRQLRIYDRWGEEVFVQQGGRTNDPGIGWDGNFRGQRMSPGVFTYFAELEFVDGLTQRYRGDVSLLR